MTNQNLNSNSDQIQNLKSLAGSIAHEMCNPLSAIKGCCELIKENLNQVTELLDSMTISSNRGLIVTDIILQNIKDGAIDPNKFIKLSIANIIKTAIIEFPFANKEQKELIHLNLENDFEFKGDENLMIFVLFNLLRNSLYYQAKINIWLDANSKTLHFQDNGIGIPQDKLAYIFDDFFTNNKKTGTGLGLPFCKRVMKAFGGDIICKSKGHSEEEGQGVEFVLRFE